MKEYEVKKILRGANIEGGTIKPGSIITRDDVPAMADIKIQELLDMGWLVEVKDNGEIQTE